MRIGHPDDIAGLEHARSGLQDAAIGIDVTVY
jgi:hypothetical protein